MKPKLSSVLAMIGLLAPVLGIAATMDSSLSIKGPYTTGTDSQFSVQISNYENLSGTTSFFTIAGAVLSDVKYAKYLDKSGWITVGLEQTGPDLRGQFISDTGFDASGTRTITLRVSFKTPKTYIIGYSIRVGEDHVLSSAAYPIIVSGPKILGETIPTPPLPATRSLTFGMRGDDISALQNRLTAEGVYTGPITGFFGRLTQTAVKLYQANHGIKANGVVGPATQASLNQ